GSMTAVDAARPGTSTAPGALWVSEVTKVPTEHGVALFKPGKILYEMGGVPENIARKAISIASSKMPIRTQFIISG
ncbi:ribosomal protein L16, partial [Mycobacterium tuberculosis]|nr:ribosomal protein L16 [Mycobacterium tuberculosis]